MALLKRNLLVGAYISGYLFELYFIFSEQRQQMMYQYYQVIHSEFGCSMLHARHSTFLIFH